MKKKYLTLAGRVKSELDDIEEIVAKINNGWEKYSKNSDELYLDSVALNLHDYYSAVERIFELIAREIDESIPQGASWHKDLLTQMSIEIKNSRPKVISKESRKIIDEYRGFRHIVRNVYTYKFSSEKIKILVGDLEEANNKLLTEIEDFIDFLEKSSYE